jgi:hypothetical protein
MVMQLNDDIAFHKQKSVIVIKEQPYETVYI